MNGNQVILKYQECDAWGADRLRLYASSTREGSVFLLIDATPRGHKCEINKNCYITLQDFDAILGDILSQQMPVRPPEDPHIWLDPRSYSFSVSSEEHNFSNNWRWQAELPPEWDIVRSCLEHLRACPAVDALMKAVTQVCKDRVQFWDLGK